MMHIKHFAAAMLLAIAGFAGAQTAGERQFGTISAIDPNQSSIEVDEQLFRFNRMATITGLADQPVRADALEPGLLIEFTVSGVQGPSGTPTIEQINALPK